MANGQSRVGIGSFLEELQATIGDNTQTPEEPEESLLETITKPRYEVPGLSTYSRVVGKLSKILNASIDKGDIKPFVDPIYGTQQEPVRDLPSLIAPMSGDPETGKYSYLDIAFGGLEGAAGMQAVSKGIAGVRRSAGKIPPLTTLEAYEIPDFEATSRLARQQRVDRIIANLDDASERAEAGALRARLARDRDISIEDLQSLPVEERRDAIEAALSTGRTRRERRLERIRKEFEPIDDPELEYIQEIAASDIEISKTKILSPDIDYRKLDLTTMEENVGTIVKERISLGHQFDRDLVISREHTPSADRFSETKDRIKIYSLDPETQNWRGYFEFDIKDYEQKFTGFDESSDYYKKKFNPMFKGRKVVDNIHWFSRRGDSLITRKHSHKILTDFVTNTLKNDWIIQERGMSFDALTAMLREATRQNAQLIFESRGFQKTSALAQVYSRWGKLSRRGIIDSQGKFSEEGLDIVIREFNDMIEKHASKDLVTGDPMIRKTKDLREKKMRMLPQSRNQIAKKIRAENPGLDNVEIDSMVEAEIKATIGKAGKKEIHTEVEYHYITIGKFKQYAASALGFSGVKELEEFLNYNPESIESQIFDTEQLF